MKLRNKTFLYSIIISLIVGATIFSYMLFLMPSMYMDYKEKENFNYAKEATLKLKNEGSIRNLKSTDSNTLGIIIPGKGYELKFSGVGYDGSLTVPKGSARKIMDKFRSMKREEDWKDSKKVEKEFKPLLLKAVKDFVKPMVKEGLPKIKSKENLSQFKATTEKIHRIEKDTGIGEFSVENKVTGTSYTTFIGYTKVKDKTYLTFVNSITPRATEIRPVIIRGIPLMILMMILLAFGVSAVYSRKIVNPVKKLSMDAEKRMTGDLSRFSPIEVKGKDEISDLAETLNLLYESQAESFKKLEEENRRKEVFMRASSHQLKTPIAASFLLIDGMISKIGKFSDRDEYLPKVKEQLQEMMNIVDEVVNLNHIVKSREVEDVNMQELCEGVIYKNNINAESKGIKIQLLNTRDSTVWRGNREMLEKILYNLISNGIAHNEREGEVKVQIDDDKVTVTNRPAHIDEEIIEHIFEPFVTSAPKAMKEGEKGHGLGLYVAKYFAESMGFTLKARNLKEEVEFVLERENSVGEG